jgi:hypothetical protein
MAHQDVTRTVRCEIRYFGQNNNAANVFHVRYTTAFTDTEADALFATINTWLDTDWKDNAAALWTANEVVLTNLNSLAGIRRVYPIQPPIAGTITDPGLPANVTVAVHGSTGTRGRGKSARWYWVGLSEGQIDGSTLLLASGNAIDAALNALLDTIAGGAMFDGMAVPHLVVGGTRPSPAESEIIVKWSLSDYILDSQVDRLPFHKKHKRRTTTP